jgi:hypothetical protein
MPPTKNASLLSNSISPPVTWRRTSEICWIWDRVVTLPLLTTALIIPSTLSAVSVP